MIQKKNKLRIEKQLFMLLITHRFNFLGLFFLFCNCSLNSLHAQSEINSNQFNRDSISRYIYDEDIMRDIIDSSDLFLENLTDDMKSFMISEFPNSLTKFKNQRINRLENLRNVVFNDTLNYKRNMDEGLYFSASLYDSNSILRFKHLHYGHGYQKFSWFNEKELNMVVIEMIDDYYEEKLFIGNKLIKKVLIIGMYGNIQYYDLQERIIFNAFYENGRIEKGEFYNHNSQQTSTILW
jgi:hypothetical protein